MSHDPGYWRFFAYLNLFMVSMLLLVLADNFLVVFVAWELVGLSSYLLIGFWKHKQSAALAAKKAFLVNRVGDVGFALGIMAIFVNTGTLNIRDSIAGLTAAGASLPIPIWIVALLVFAGAVGKSAQFPLHVWLPDAMEGPTPVSALIHAATMVNAGVYLVARTNPIFASAPDVDGDRRRDRHLHRDPRRLDRDDPDRHQAGPRLLDAEPARLHVRGARRRRVHRGDLPPDDPRLLQGPAVPRLGLRDPRGPRGAGHAPDGRAADEDPADLPDDADRLDRDRRHPAAGRLLQQGRDPRRGVQARLPVGLGDRDRRRAHDRVLHVPADRADVLGRDPRSNGGRGPHPRIAAGHDRAAVAARRSRRSSSGIILSLPGPPLGPLLGFAPDQKGLLATWLEPVFAQGEALLGRAEASFSLFGIDGVLILASVAVAVIGMVVAWRLFGAELWRLRWTGNPERVRTLTARVPFLYRASLNKWWFDDLNHLLFMVIGGRVAAFLWWFDRRVIDDTVNDVATETVAAGTRPAPGPDRPRPELRPRDRPRPDRDGRIVPRPGGPVGSDEMDFPILTVSTFTPLVGALIIAVAPARYARRARPSRRALVAWVVSLLLIIGFDPHSPRPFQFEEQVPWIPLFGIDYHLGVDGLSLDPRRPDDDADLDQHPRLVRADQGPDQGVHGLVPVLEVGMIGVFVSLDTFLFYIFWEIVLVPMYLIIGIWGGANRIYATIKFVLYTLVGSLLMLVAILTTAFAYQAANNGSCGRARSTSRTSGRSRFDPTLQLFAFLAFFLAFAIKVPMWPFHTWLPDAHVQAPTAGSVILAAIMLKLGAYGMIRFALPLFPGAAHTFAPAIIVLSLIAIIYGAIVALVQPDLKKLVAYSSVSHMGFVTLGIFVFNTQGMDGAILQMVNHGLITGALFLLVGVIYERTHDRTIAKMGGVAGGDAGLRGRPRVLRLRLGRAAGSGRLRRRVPRPRRRVPVLAVGRRDRHGLHDPRRAPTCSGCTSGSCSASCPSSSRASATT